MTPEQAKVVLLRLVGRWPTPVLTPAEALVWAEELTDPHLAIEPAEAVEALTAMSRTGATFRPRVGQFVAAIRASRRKTAPALQRGLLSLGAGEEIAPPEIRAEHLASMRTSIAAGKEAMAVARSGRRGTTSTRTPDTLAGR